jgi:hypothetical protein
MFTMSNTVPGTYVKHVPKAPNKSILQESLSMPIMLTMSNTLPGSCVKHVQKAPNFIYFTRVSEPVNNVYHVQHTTWNLCQTCSKCT